MTLAEYISALSHIRAALAAGDVAAARAEAATLRGSDVTAADEHFAVDATLLGQIDRARPHDVAVEARLDATIDALRRSGAAAPPAPQPALLERIAREQAEPQLRRGGEIRAPDLNEPLLTRIGRAFDRGAQWLGHKIGQLIDWLSKLWPMDATRDEPATSGRMRWLVGTLVALIVVILGVLAFEVIRRSRNAAAAAVEQESAPIASSRDDDPLSRGTSEWERYAAQLAAEGRLREAIRAWYHAVLVALYGAAVLHHRKGRTNWEYVATLSPSIPWRQEMIHLTRRFEQEWYGSERSSDEALDECRAAAVRILGEVRAKGRAA